MSHNFPDPYVNINNLLGSKSVNASAQLRLIVGSGLAVCTIIHTVAWLVHLIVANHPGVFQQDLVELRHVFAFLARGSPPAEVTMTTSWR